jgi:hypothetical protein
VAERSGRGLQNLVDGFDSRPRLHFGCCQTRRIEAPFILWFLCKVGRSPCGRTLTDRWAASPRMNANAHSSVAVGMFSGLHDGMLTIVNPRTPVQESTIKTSGSRGIPCRCRNSVKRRRAVGGRTRDDDILRCPQSEPETHHRGMFAWWQLVLVEACGARNDNFRRCPEDMTARVRPWPVRRRNKTSC